MDKNSENFFKELAVLLEKYEANVWVSGDGEVEFCVGEKVIDREFFSFGAMEIREFLEENQ